MKAGPGILLVLLLGASLAWAQVCGDCDLDGNAPTIIDALVAAQLAAGAAAATPPQTAACDVDSTHSITVVDALRMAQVSAGLPVTLSCPGAGSPPTCTILAPQPTDAWFTCGCGPIQGQVEVAVDDPDLDPVDLTFEYSLDGGVTWAPLESPLCGNDPNPILGVATPAPVVVYTFWVEFTSASAGTIRVTATDGVLSSQASVTPVWFDPPWGPICVCLYDPSTVILVDRSASMGTGILATPIPGNPTPTPWEGACYDAQVQIASLGCRDNFLLAVFDTAITYWQVDPRPATAAEKLAAQQWLDGLPPPAGSAAYSVAVDAVVNLQPNPVDHLMLLSDGQPALGYAEVAATTAANGGVAMIDTHLFGAIAGQPLTIMTDIAAQNGGMMVLYP
jgi:hypothetical protein